MFYAKIALVEEIKLCDQIVEPIRNKLLLGQSDIRTLETYGRISQQTEEKLLQIKRQLSHTIHNL